MRAPAAAGPPDNLFLPDFCEIRMVFSVVVVGELLAFVIALTLLRGSGNGWNDLALVSLFIQWVGLTSAALLCASRRWLRLLDNVRAGLLSFALILLVTGALSEAVYWLVRGSTLHFDLPVEWHLEFLLRNLGIAAIVAALMLRYLYVQFQWKRNVEAEARAHFQALQSRIRPHFLFNSMNTIASLTRSQPALAEQVVEDLADLFRASLGEATQPVTLARELEVARQYLRIEALRLGERLAAQWQVEALPEDALLPALSLQPLIENAVYHGIEPAPGGGCVHVRGERDGGQLRIVISNSLPGADARGGGRGGNRMAQDNVRQRLRAFFGPGAGLEVRDAGGEYRVQLTFPYLSGSP